MSFRAWRTGTIGCLLLAATSTAAYAQLTPEDIDALRLRGMEEGWTFTVGENPATEYPLEQLCGAVEPPDWRDGAIFDACLPSRDLPSYWSWQWGGCTPVKSQGSCGSCWAFGAIGPVESAIRIATSDVVSLSEQWLISCTDSGDCGGGWHTEAYEYLVENGWQDPCGGSGGVLTSDCPYLASNAPCDCPYPHPYPISSWAAVGYVWDIPSVEQIKQAIYDYGPVSACVYVNGAFQAYTGGVFNSCDDNHWINHVVTLVGWSDSQQAWIMKNSWGTGWGAGGYMRIRYNCSHIGYATCYVTYTPQGDCNANGVPDEMDIAQGTSQDCNGNAVPDECDIADGTVADANANGVPDSCEIYPGDVDCDGDVDFDDIDPFVLAITGEAAFRTVHPDCLHLNGDCDGDGDVDFDDITPFVGLLGR